MQEVTHFSSIQNTYSTLWILPIAQNEVTSQKGLHCDGITSSQFNLQDVVKDFVLV